MDTDKLLKTIKVIIKKEIKSTLKPLIREMIENEVNSVLAEKFLQNISSNQSLLKDRQEPKTVVNAKIANENVKKELMKKMGVDQDPIASLIYEDVNLGSESAADDDEGVDISIFGL